MSVTASRLGSAPLTLDWSNLMKSGGHSPGGQAEGFAQAWATLQKRFSAGEVGFYEAPLHEGLSAATESVQLAEKILSSRQFTDCLFLGIGGSALGPVSLLGALKHRAQSGIRFHFQENPDPIDWQHTLAGLRPDSTLVCVVTKSGTTFETLAQAILAMKWLGRERLKSHMIAITDPDKGDLRAFARAEGFTTLPIAPSMGGRFSIFTPVGLFPAALAGLSVPDFLLGAKQVRQYVDKTPLEKNPLFIIGAELIRQFAKHPIHVCMPYSTMLRSMSAWFVQLWGESLGKDGKGFTPLAAVGATDQHSILQLLRDGPNDKVTLFLAVDQVEDPVQIPATNSLPAFKILEGHSLQELLMIELRATSLVLTKNSRPNLTCILDRLDERSMGALYYAFSVLTAFTGTLWGVNPFDQPGVEEGKVYIREALSQELRS